MRRRGSGCLRRVWRACASVVSAAIKATSIAAPRIRAVGADMICNSAQSASTPLDPETERGQIHVERGAAQREPARRQIGRQPAGPMRRVDDRMREERHAEHRERVAGLALQRPGRGQRSPRSRSSDRRRSRPACARAAARPIHAPPTAAERDRHPMREAQLADQALGFGRIDPGEPPHEQRRARNSPAGRPPAGRGPFPSRFPTILPAMRAVDIIRKKRDGGELDAEAIRAFVAGATDGSWADYQLSRAADGDRAARHVAGRGRCRSPRRWSSRASGSILREFGGVAGRQALHRRRGRQAVAGHCAAGRGLRRDRADDVRPRARPHGRDARQTRSDSRVPHRACRSTKCARCCAGPAAC